MCSLVCFFVLCLCANVSVRCRSLPMARWANLRSSFQMALLFLLLLLLFMDLCSNGERNGRF